jgi:hypothetical protein
MKKAGVLVSCVFFLCVLCLAGCATAPKPAKPDDCSDSLIYKYIPEPELTGSLLVTGTQFMTTKFPESKKFVVLMFQELGKMLDDEKVTYSEFATLLQNNIVWINDYFQNHALVSTMVMVFANKPVKISTCDVRLLKRLVAAELKALQ